MLAMPACSRCPATHSLAASMNSSMMRLAILRGARVTPVMAPNSSNSIDPRDAGLLQVSGDALIGGQHELLDDAVGDIARRPRDARHGAQFVELDERLGKIEIDGAAAHAFLVEHQRQFLHELEALYQWLIALAHGGVAFQQQVDVG